MFTAPAPGNVESPRKVNTFFRRVSVRNRSTTCFTDHTPYRYPPDTRQVSNFLIPVLFGEEIARLEQLLKGAFTCPVWRCVLKSCLHPWYFYRHYCTLKCILRGQSKLIARQEQLPKGAFARTALKCILKLCLSCVLVSDDASYSFAFWLIRISLMQDLSNYLKGHLHVQFESAF
jgi:hypothetical protein